MLNKARIYLIVGVLIGLVIGGGLFLAGRGVVNRVRATPRATPVPKAGATIVPTVAAKAATTPVAGGAPSVDSQVALMRNEAAGLANILGFSSYQWTPILYPTGTSAADIQAYYAAEVQKTGWTGKVNTFADSDGHSVWAWLESDSRTGFVVAYVPSTGTGPTFVLTLSGQGPDVETPTPESFNQ